MEGGRKKNILHGLQSQKIEIRVYSIFLCFQFLLGSLQGCLCFICGEHTEAEVCLWFLILPANHAGEAQKRERDQGGLNLCFIVVVVIVWGIILGEYV